MRTHAHQCCIIVLLRYELISILTAYIVTFSTFLVSPGVFCKTHLIFQSIKKNCHYKDLQIIETYGFLAKENNHTLIATYANTMKLVGCVVKQPMESH